MRQTSSASSVAVLIWPWTVWWLIHSLIAIEFIAAYARSTGAGVTFYPQDLPVISSLSAIFVCGCSIRKYCDARPDPEFLRIYNSDG